MPLRPVVAVLSALIALLVLPFTAHADAYDDTMHMYESGKYAKAMTSWTLLAEQGHVQAQYNLGFMYEFGYGVEPGEAEAFKWYLRAAQSGHRQAQHSVAWMYKLGKGTAQNSAEAERWMQLSTTARDGAVVDTMQQQSDAEQVYTTALLEKLKSEFGLAGHRYEALKASATPQVHDLEASNHTS